VVDVFDGLRKAGKVATAALTLAYGRACYRWAERRGKLPANPFAGLPLQGAPKARDRVLSDAEVGEVWRAAGTLGWPFGPMLRLLLLTAQRREEVAALRWSELASDLSVWTIPAARAKNGREHVVHLSAEARAVLADLPRLAGSDLVFTTTGKAPVSGYSRAAARLAAAIAKARGEAAKEAGGRGTPLAMPDWRWHDFRRTAVTWMAGAGFPPHVADKLLNHTTTTGLSDVARIYQRAEFLSERKAAIEAWGAHVAACGAGRVATGNVTAIAAERRARRRRA
jgi:integrase